MEGTKKTLQFAALVPHGNIAAQMETERRLLKKHYGLRAFYPLVCPLAFFSESPANTPKNILTDFGNFFQSCSTVSILPLTVSADSFYRQFSACGQQPFKTEQCDLGTFTLETGRFLYGTIPANTESASQLDTTPISTPEYSNAIPLRIFKLAFFSFTYSQPPQSKNCLFEWTENESLWIKLR